MSENHTDSCYCKFIILSLPNEHAGYFSNLFKRIKNICTNVDNDDQITAYITYYMYLGEGRDKRVLFRLHIHILVTKCPMKWTSWTYVIFSTY